jgi:hypothetical protein
VVARHREPSPVPERLPRADEGQIDPRKLRDYALNADHEPDGKHKARLFKATLGLGREDWGYLRNQVLDRVSSTQVTAIRAKREGVWEYEVIVQIDGLNGRRHPVVTGWLVEGDTPPRLTTAYPDV